jgi:ABC-type nitrate/sulfonate/bicarbonate transport system substrate-binding protein
MGVLRPLGLAAVLVSAIAVGWGGPPSASVAAAGGASAAASVVGASGAQTAVPLSIGLVSYTALQWPLFAAQSIGSLDQEGLALDVSPLGGAPQVTAAMASGSVNIGNADMYYLIRAVERGADVAAFMSEFPVPIYGLLANPNVRSYADLRGQTIIVDSPNGVTRWLTGRMLAQGGVAPNEADYVFAGATPDRLAAMVAGGVQAAILAQPFDFAAERQGYRRLGNSNDLVRTFEFISYTANRDWMSRNENTLARFIRGYRAGQRWLYDPANKEQAIQLLSAQTRLAPEDSRATYELYVERVRAFPEGMRPNPAGVQAVLDSLVELGDLTTPTPPVTKYVDTTYVERYGQ